MEQLVVCAEPLLGPSSFTGRVSDADKTMAPFSSSERLSDSRTPWNREAPTRGGCHDEGSSLPTGTTYKE